MLSRSPPDVPPGFLNADATSGLALRGNGAFRGVFWPFGYPARRESGGIVLIDRSDRIVAREGDQVVMGGAIGEDGVGYPCDPLDLEIVRVSGATTTLVGAARAARCQATISSPLRRRGLTKRRAEQGLRSRGLRPSWPCEAPLGRRLAPRSARGMLWRPRVRLRLPGAPSPHTPGSAMLARAGAKSRQALFDDPLLGDNYSLG